jgi:hypothetical protein
MTTEKKTTSTTKRKTTRKTTAKTAKTTKAEEVEKVEKPKHKKRVRIGKDETFYVKSNVVGGLYFCSKDKSFEQEWYSSDDEVELTFEELQKIRRQSKIFFSENWLVVEDQDYSSDPDDHEPYTAKDVYTALNVNQYYDDCITSIEEMDELFTKSPKEIAMEVSKMSQALKETLASRAIEQIEEGNIDSNRVISALSSSLNIDLEEAIR